MGGNVFYTVEKLVSSDGETLDGNKSVVVYDIVNNIPKVWFTLDLVLSDNCEAAIQDYLNDNGYGDESFNFVNL